MKVVVADPSPVDPTRLVVSHALAATGMAMAWPALLAAVWASNQSELSLGLAGAARMAPYVLLSLAAGALADRVRRLRLVRISTWMRALVLLANAGAFAGGLLTVAVALATVAIAVGTPAYPALVAAMPRVAGGRTTQVTGWLVTAEVSAFVVGPAIGGLLLGTFGPTCVVVTAGMLGVVAALALPGVGAEPEPVALSGRAGAGTAMGLLRIRPVRTALVVVATVNLVDAACALTLLSMSDLIWGGQGFGYATAALGFGALAAPAVGRVVGPLPVAVVVLAGSLLAVVVSPTHGWALLPLALFGAVGTQVECVATGLLQRYVPDGTRALALGLADTTMVLAGLMGAALAPALAALVGPRLTLIVLAGVVLVVPAVASVHVAAVVRRRQGAPRTEAPLPTKAPACSRTGGAHAGPRIVP